MECSLHHVGKCHTLANRIDIKKKKKKYRRGMRLTISICLISVIMYKSIKLPFNSEAASR